jgi:hypothetical protein
MAIAAASKRDTASPTSPHLSSHLQPITVRQSSIYQGNDKLNISSVCLYCNGPVAMPRCLDYLMASRQQLVTTRFPEESLAANPAGARLSRRRENQ